MLQQLPPHPQPLSNLISVLSFAGSGRCLGPDRGAGEAAAQSPGAFTASCSCPPEQDPFSRAQVIPSTPKSADLLEETDPQGPREASPSAGSALAPEGRQGAMEVTVDKQEGAPDLGLSGPSTAATTSECALGEGEGPRCKGHAWLPPEAEAEQGWVPSEEMMRKQLRAYEVIVQLRMAARRWAAHQDNFFFHWNRIGLEWRLATPGDPGASGAPGAPRSQKLGKANSTQTPRVVRNISNVKAESTDVQQRTEDTVDILCSILPKLASPTRPFLWGAQSPEVVGLLQQLDARRRALEPSYSPLNRFLSVPSGGTPVVRTGSPYRQDSFCTLSIDGAVCEEHEAPKGSQGPYAVNGAEKQGGTETKWLEGPLVHGAAVEGLEMAFHEGLVLLRTCTPPASLPAAPATATSSPAAAAAARAIRAAAAGLNLDSWVTSYSWDAARALQAQGGCGCCKDAAVGGRGCDSSTCVSGAPGGVPFDQGVMGPYGAASPCADAVLSEMCFQYGAPRTHPEGPRGPLVGGSGISTKGPPYRSTVATWVRRMPRMCPGKRSISLSRDSGQGFYLPERGGSAGDPCGSVKSDEGAPRHTNGCKLALEEAGVETGMGGEGFMREGFYNCSNTCVTQLATDGAPSATEGPSQDHTQPWGPLEQSGWIEGPPCVARAEQPNKRKSPQKGKQQQQQQQKREECAVLWATHAGEKGLKAAPGWWAPAGTKTEEIATPGEMGDPTVEHHCGAAMDTSPCSPDEETPVVTDGDPALADVSNGSEARATPTNAVVIFESSHPKVIRKTSHIVVEDAGVKLSFVARKGVYYDKRRRLWRANWKENGRIHTKGFSVHDYRSHQVARQKAIEFREQKEQEIEIYQQVRCPKSVQNETDWVARLHPKGAPFQAQGGALEVMRRRKASPSADSTMEDPVIKQQSSK